MGDLTNQVAWSPNQRRIHPEQQEKHDKIMTDLFNSDHSDFDLTSITTAKTATIKYKEKMYKFTIIPGGNYNGDGPKTFTITNIPGEEGMYEDKTQFLNEILGERIVLTVDKMKPADIIISPDTSYSSSTMLDRTYVFELVTGAGGGGGGGGAASRAGGGKSVRRRSRKRYSRRRRVSNKKYSASRRGRGRGRGRGRRSRKN
jgi:hypothetical protein